MTTRYRKRPQVTRFVVKQTRPGRIVRKTKVERRERKRSQRNLRPVRQIRKRTMTGR